MYINEVFEEHLNRAEPGSVIMASTNFKNGYLPNYEDYRGFKIEEHDEWSWGWMIRNPDGSFLGE